MTLQERMIAVYLRQANLPPEEKGKLRLFLGLLLETMEEDDREAPSSAPLGHLPSQEEGRAEQSRAEQSRAPATPATTFSGEERKNDPLPATVPSTAAANTLLEKAPGAEDRSDTEDPLSEALLAALEKLGMTPESREAERYFGIRGSVLQNLLEGKAIRKDSRARIHQRVQDAGIAVSADAAEA